MYMCVCVSAIMKCYHENNMSSWLSPQWLALWELMHLGTSGSFVVNHL